MSSNYMNMTGVLVLSKVTAIITALFGAFDLDADEPGGDEVYIANMAESTNASWAAVLENLQELVGTLGLSLPADVDGDFEQTLWALAGHFKVDENEDFASLVEQVLFEGDADLDVLWALAMHFDDGHGLKAIRTESSWHSSKAELFEFGGAGNFYGRHVRFGFDSSDVVTLGADLEVALAAQNRQGAAEVVVQHCRRILGTISDPAECDAVTDAVKKIFSLSPGDEDPRKYASILELMTAELPLYIGMDVDREVLKLHPESGCGEDCVRVLRAGHALAVECTDVPPAAILTGVIRQCGVFYYG